MINGKKINKNDCWETPQWLFDKLNQRFCFQVDAASSNENKKCPTAYSEEENGLSKNWGG